jgi:two-component system sensor histidine kinase HydH
MWVMGGLLGTVVWGGIIVLVGILWFRTRKYQATLSQNRELLQFAQASRTLGHEIQNPLASILLQTALLKRSSPDVPPEVAVIEEEAQRISGLVARVRDFLKDPQGQPEVLDLAALLEMLGGRQALPVIVEIEGVPPFSVKFDPYRLRSVVENLLKNAVESGPAPEVGARLSRPRAGWLRLEVADSGAGFTEETLNRALDPFFTTKTSGTGIGLSIADGFVRAAGGRLKLENRREGGARVSVELPETKAP